MDRPKLGQAVRVTAKAVKTRTGTYSNYRVEWKRVPVPPLEGVYVGYRVVYDGAGWWGEYERGFVPHKSHGVYLIVINDRVKPFHAFPDDVGLLDTMGLS